MEQTDIKPNRKLWVVVGVLVALAIVAAVAVYAVMSSSKQQGTTASSTSQQPFPRIATKDQVKQNLTDLNRSLKQATADQAAAKAALQESQNQVKVGN